MTKTIRTDGPQPIDGRFQALESFKDWSNYLLVTTVAALGWVAEQNSSPSPSLALSLAVWCLGISTAAGIFTLALVPLIAEQMDKEASIYLVPAQFYLGRRALWTMYLSQACRPQHVSFIVGILLYCVAKTQSVTASTLQMPWSLIAPVALVAIFVQIGRLSHRR